MIRIDYDAAANAGYLHLANGHEHVHTVEITPSLMLDIGPDGLILGVESVSGPVDLMDLAQVLQRLRWLGTP